MLPDARILGEVVRIDGQARDVLRRQFAHGLAGKPRNLTLQAAHARFPAVIPDQVADGLVGDDPFLFLEAVILTHLRNQVALGDLQLLVLGVASDADDLHAVQQGLGHVERVRRRHEHHVRQVIVDLQIVIVERRVLLRIEHFQQRRGRIAAMVHAHLVDLVQKEQRVAALGLLQALDHPARHRADIGPAVAADLAFVAHAAQRHAHKVASRGFGNRAAE